MEFQELCQKYVVFSATSLAKKKLFMAIMLVPTSNLCFHIYLYFHQISHTSRGPTLLSKHDP